MDTYQQANERIQLMPPKVKFQKEEIIRAALTVARERGLEAVTAREIAKELGVSTRPIFTYYDTMDQLKSDICEMAKDHYREYIEAGLKEDIPFLGTGLQYIRFAREEPEMYKMLFLTKPGESSAGAIESLKFTQDLVRGSIMDIYNMDAFTADCYYRDLWFVAFSIGTLIVTDDCPYTDEEISEMFSQVSLSLCMGFKNVPGLAKGDYCKDVIFSELVKK